VLLVVLAYLPVLRAGFVWDDDWHVTDNVSLRSVEGLKRIWLRPGGSAIVVPQYYPLTHTVFWVEHHLWGLRPAGWHLVNVLLHGAAAVLFWRLLVRLGIPAAWAAATLWAVHPVNVESVAWVTETKNVLSAVFYFAAAIAYLRFDDTRSGRWYAAALGLFLCALLAKTVASTLPAALLLVLWWKRGVIRAREVVPSLPLFALGAAFGGVTSWMEHHLIGAVGGEWSFTPAERVLIAGRAVWFYAGKLLWPVGLAFNYVRWTIDTGSLVAWIFPVAAAVAVGAAFAARRRIGRGPVAAMLFFIGTLAPALGFFDVYPMRYSFVADHFQYVASAGVIVLVAGIGATVLGTGWMRRAGAAVAIAVLAALTRQRAGVFEGSVTLWRDTLAKNPTSWLAHANLERYYTAAGDTAKAIEEADAVVALRPADARARSRLGLTLAAAGRRDAARREHEKAVELDSDDGLIRYNYGLDLIRWGDRDAAERQFREALARDPKTPGVRTHLGVMLAERGDVTGAIELYRQELEQSPDSPTALNNLANALLKLGRVDEAIAEYRELLGMDPDNAKGRNTAAIVLMRRNDPAGAERELRRALAAEPALAEAHNTLGVVLVMQGRLDEAIAEYREALRLRPGYPTAERNLAAALAEREKAGTGG
jgi:Flp pilus assembly protein TadD